MSGFFWNIRGFNKQSKHLVAKEWIRRSGFQFGCFIETRVKENRVKGILEKVVPGWSYLANYEHNSLGRIWFTWNPKVRVTPCFQSAQLVTVSILMEGCVEEVFCSCVYGKNLADERRELWQNLKDHQDSPIIQKAPWIIFGDFNEILDVEEHSVDASNDSMGMREFQDTVTYCSLLDMAYQGPLFTWSNKRINEVICKKLDRVMMNEAWMRSFPQSYNVFEAGGCSDHQRCRMVFKAEAMKLRKPFKFVNALVDMPDFQKMVEEYWSETVPLFNSTSALYRLSKKLKSLKPHLRRLSKEKFADIFKKTSEAYKTLCLAQMKTLDEPNQGNMEAESAAYDRWSLLSRIEEKVISQRAKYTGLRLVMEIIKISTGLRR